jgi:hypothetical protein
MDTFYQLFLPGLVAPLALATLTLRLHWQGAWGVALIWFISYFWLRGLPNLPPREAADWLWLIGLATLAAAVIPDVSRWRWLWLSGLLAMYLAVIAWPVMRHDGSVMLFVEFVVVVVAGAASIQRLIDGHATAFDALTMAIVSAGYAVVAALGGSLLVGLLSGALAAALGGYALYELMPRRKTTLLPVRAALLASIWLLCLMFIGRVYAGLPLGPLALLLAALVLNRVLPVRGLGQAVMIAGIPTVSALAWLVLTQDSSSYY